VQHGGAAGIAYALVLGVLLGTVRQRTGRVWPGWVLHTVNNLLVFAAG
jgi:membrane protease YdiL (CAAX protease family)